MNSLHERWKPQCKGQIVRTTPDDFGIVDERSIQLGAAHSRAITGTVGPELIDDDLALAGADHWHAGFVDVDAPATVHSPELALIKAFEPPVSAFEPA